MPNSQFHTAISSPRYLRYLHAAGNRRNALKLYRANIVLSQRMFAIIGILEIVLRNSIDRYMITMKGINWLEEAVAPGGFFEINPGCEYSYHTVREVIVKLGVNYTHDSLIANLSLGFWRYQFAPLQYTASGNTLLSIFVNQPQRVSQKDIFRLLAKVNETRNRIAHHEPICFHQNLISTTKIEKRYHTILQLLEWLGSDPKKILYGIDAVRKSIDIINSIHSPTSSAASLSAAPVYSPLPASAAFDD